MKLILCVLLILFSFPFKTFSAEVLQVTSPSILQVGDNNTITAAGAISTDYNVTYINDPSGGGTCSIGAGLDGQIIIIIMSSNSGGHTIQVSGANVAQTISLDAAGESATMLYDTGLSKWFFIGGSATVT